MKPTGGILARLGRRRIVAAALCLIFAGAAFAGWRVQRATDTTRVDPIAIPHDINFQCGDIIIAGGVSLQSRVVMSFTQGNRYSHVGMIQVTPKGLFVIHAAPAGAGDGGVGDRVARIPLSLFLAERGYVAVKVLRLKDQADDAAQIARDACDYANDCAEQAIPFDGAFDLNQNKAMYCSELVYLAYLHAGHRWPDKLIQEVSTVLVDGPVILPDAFAQCDAFEIIWKHSSEREIP